MKRYFSTYNKFTISFFYRILQGMYSFLLPFLQRHVQVNFRKIYLHLEQEKRYLLKKDRKTALQKLRGVMATMKMEIEMGCGFLATVSQPQSQSHGMTRGQHSCSINKLSSAVHPSLSTRPRNPPSPPPTKT